MPAETICLQGTVRKGNKCWRLERPDAAPMFLIGDLSKVHDGDSVTVCGNPAQATFCGEGEALAVSFIGTDVGGKDALPKSVIRHIQITATLSERDLSPTFKLEQRKLNLHAANGVWRGSFKNVHVDGELDVFFNSEGWKNQKFTVSVVATDPADPKKTWPKEFEGVVEKEHVVIDETMDVGAAPPAPVAV